MTHVQADTNTYEYSLSVAFRYSLLRIVWRTWLGLHLLESVESQKLPCRNTSA